MQPAEFSLHTLSTQNATIDSATTQQPGFISGPMISVALVLLLIAVVNQSRRSLGKRPPGPRRLPIIGNALNMPKDHPWRTFKKWADEYNSDILSYSFFGQETIVLNSHTATQDLFVKKSSVFSDRPQMPMLNDLVGFKWNFAFMPYGPAWKEHRKMFKQEAESPENPIHEAHITRSVHRLMDHLLEAPSEYVGHIRHLSSSIVLSLAYGIDIKQNHDPFIQMAGVAMEGMARTAIIGSYLVDYIPILRHVPAWAPGPIGRWRREADHWAKYVAAVPEVPFDLAVKEYEKGNGTDCIVSRVLNRLQGEEEEVRKHKLGVLKNILGVVYAAGSDTTVSSLLTFLLAMLLYPDVQRKAQAEIEAAVGNKRRPNFNDVDSIPYVHALVRETLRWQPVGPLAALHSASEDTIYRGYLIKKGTIITGNAWAIMQDESIYGARTDQFCPERFLMKTQTTGPDHNPIERDVLDPSVLMPNMAFGFGRRICPGRHIAYSTLWLAICSILHAFNVKKARDGRGEEITPRVNYTSGLLSFPEPFLCEFEPRSDREGYC